MRNIKFSFTSGKAPDMSHLDAGFCPYMERQVEASGAETVEDIRKAVKRAWGKITDEMCVAVSKRVRINMANVIKLKGGNFYTEGSGEGDEVSVQSSAVYCAVGMMATGPRVPMVRVPAHGCM